MLTRTDLIREAGATGFQAEPLEKVIRLLGLLDALRSHPFLKTRIALKGGTALNLFVSEVPRLSVDIDLNYLGAAERETMQADRPKVEQAIRAVCGRLGIGIKRSPTDHAGGKWRLSYITVSGQTATRRPPDGRAGSSMIAEATFRQCYHLPRRRGSSLSVSTRRAISSPSCSPATRFCRPRSASTPA